MTKRKSGLFAALLLLVSFVASFSSAPLAKATGCANFAETGFNVCGDFLTYWQSHGGLAQQGFPISGEFTERNAAPPAGDGQLHTVQYFQRARFELHSENAYPNNVLLGLLGTEQLTTKYAPYPKESPDNRCRYFPETGFNLCGGFLTYWNTHGGLAQQGYPISYEFDEANLAPPSGDGRIHTVQYFQRARFELHEELNGQILLGLLGSEQWAKNRDNPFSLSTYTLFKAVVGGEVGNYAMTTVTTSPNAACSIRYISPSGKESNSSNDGNLRNKNADGNGEVSWSWLIDANTPYGTGQIIVTCNGSSNTTTITIKANPNPPPTTPAQPTTVTEPAVLCLSAVTTPVTSGPLYQACVSDPNPKQYSDVGIAARLLINGKAVTNVTMHAVWHYRTSTPICDSYTGDYTGNVAVAACQRNIGDATIGYTVTIDIYLTYNGQTYQGKTGFTPIS